jgi:hypothetical protein
MIEVRNGKLKILKPDGTSWGLSLEEQREKCLRFLKVAKTPEEKLDFQRALIQITADINPDEMEGLYGIRIVERKEERPESEGCFEYAVGADVDIQEFFDNMIANYKMLEAPQAGAYALYLTFEDKPCHIGIVTEKGTVISKWGPKCHVYEHEPKMTPLCYGDVVYYSP